MHELRAILAFSDFSHAVRGARERRRAKAPTPSSPRPIRPTEAGSGTAVGVKVMSSDTSAPTLAPAPSTYRTLMLDASGPVSSVPCATVISHCQVFEVLDTAAPSPVLSVQRKPDPPPEQPPALRPTFLMVFHTAPPGFATGALSRVADTSELATFGATVSIYSPPPVYAEVFTVRKRLKISLTPPIETVL